GVLPASHHHLARPLHFRRRFLAHVAALCFTGFGIRRDDIALALARVHAFAVAVCRHARALSFAGVGAQTFDLLRLRRRTRLLRAYATGESHGNRRGKYRSQDSFLSHRESPFVAPPEVSPASF